MNNLTHLISRFAASRVKHPSKPPRRKLISLGKLLIVCLISALLAPQSYSQAHTAGNTAAAGMNLSAQPQSSEAMSQQAGDHPRRVNIPYFSGEISWVETTVFWFGINEQGYPSRNYVDVRAAYSSEGLVIRFVVIDYFLWYKTNPQPGDDLTQFDAAAIYLDTGNDRSTSPQVDDYWFLTGARHWPNEDAPQYHRQARGAGSSWDTAWSATWTDWSVMQWWCNPGPNSNNCNPDPDPTAPEIDYGWTAGVTIPWSVLGLSGPPSEGTVWGLGVQLYDRDDLPPAGELPVEFWPETFDANSPASWGELHYGLADYQPPQAVQSGSTVIQAASDVDNTVEDAWMGGGGWCQGGHNGHGEDNHGDDHDLFVGSETAPTHFPCYNKSFLRFSLDAIPPGKVIMSSTLTLYHWGNAEPEYAQPSWVHLYTITDPWEEMTIQWNNAPMAQENIAETWIQPITVAVPLPGNPYNWNATQAVAEAYADGLPASMAIYSSDSAQHSSKYLKSSETGYTYAIGRPALTVIWGDPVAVLSKQAFPWNTTLGSTVTYTLNWSGVGLPMTLSDALPVGLSPPVSIEASSGQASYDPGSHQVNWTGTPAFGEAVTLVYVVEVEVSGPAALINTALLTTEGGSTSSASVTIVVDGFSAFLPLVLR